MTNYIPRKGPQAYIQKHNNSCCSNSKKSKHKHKNKPKQHMSSTKDGKDMKNVNYINKQEQNEKEVPPAPKWEDIAREKQRPPEGDWHVWLLMAGRGFGKTRTGAETIRQWVRDGKYKRIALVGNTIQEARQVMVEGQSGILSVCADDPKEERPRFYPSKHQLVWPNGAIATLYGAQSYERLRGPQFDAAWIDEFAKFLHPRETFEQLSFGMRLGTNPRIVMTTTPRPIPFIKELMERDDVVTVRGSSMENAENLAPTFLQQLRFLKGTRLEAQEVFAEIVEDSEKSMWTWDDIAKCYKEPPHYIPKVVIGVDPAMSSGENSDETGIVVAGMDAFGKGYVLDDLSTNAPPEVWSQKVVEAAKKYRAKSIVIEKNAGGELLENLVKSKGTDAKVKTVQAITSKIDRAEPIVLLYQKNMIFHAKQFQKLEMQMATYDPDSRGDSPDHMDAMVWAMRELFQVKGDSGIFVPKIWNL